MIGKIKPQEAHILKRKSSDQTFETDNKLINRLSIPKNKCENLVFSPLLPKQ